MNDDPFERAVQRAEAVREQADAQRRARWRERWSAGHRKAFRIHATVFVAVQVLLVATWAATGHHHPWFIYPLLGWGIGLAAHYAAVREHLKST